MPIHVWSSRTPAVVWCQHFPSVITTKIDHKVQLLKPWVVCQVGEPNAKQLNIWNLTKVNGIHETKPEKITKRNEILLLMKQNETKRNEISLFLLFRETSEISRNNFVVSLCFVFREIKKRMRNGNPRWTFRPGDLLSWGRIVTRI
jgi:hypothetical protein